MTPADKNMGWGMFGLWDENTPGCAGICHALALWGAPEIMAFLALAITAVGVKLAVQSLRATEKSSADAARSARELLTHEQSAELQIPFRAGQLASQIPRGAYIWILGDGFNSSLYAVMGRLQNVGRFEAREIELSVIDRTNLLTVNSHPRDFLESGGDGDYFYFQMPNDQDSLGHQRSRSPVEIEVQYADGNIHDPRTVRIRRWKFAFPDGPLHAGDTARLISVDDYMGEVLVPF